MFNFFAPKCPIDLRRKTWIEWRWDWLGKQFGWQKMLDCQVLHPEDLPCSEIRSLSHQNAAEIFDFVAATLPIDRSRVELTVLPDDKMPEETAGLYVLRDDRSSSLNPKSNIRLAESELNSFVSTVATIAHELAHEAILGNGLLSGYEDDHEPLTDLLPSFFGYGLFTANNTVETAYWNEGNLEYSQWQRKGYLSSIELGHALALFCWLRNEQKPAWLSRLRLDAAKTLKKSLRYLSYTEDALVTPTCLSSAKAPVDSDKSLSNSRRLASIWDADSSEAGTSHVATLLSDSELTIRQEALLFISKAETVANSTLAVIENSLSDEDPWCQAMATLILAKKGISSMNVADSVCWLILHSDESYSYLAEVAASALAKTDSTFLENENVVDRIVWILASGIPGAAPDQEDFYYAHEEEGYSRSALRLQQAATAIPNLKEVLERRFPHLNAAKIVDFAKHPPFAQTDIDRLGF